MSPELVVESGEISLFVEGLLEAMKNLRVHLELVPLLARVRGRRIHGSATAALIVFHRH